MWLEQFNLNLLENVGWEEEDVFLKDALHVQRGERAVASKVGVRPANMGKYLPMKTQQDGHQYVLGASDCVHSMVLGTTGSGKSRDWFMPAILNAMASQSSMLCLDVKGEIFAHTAAMAHKMKYHIVNINLRGGATDGFNPLHIAARLYKLGKRAEAEMALTQLAEVLFPVLPANNTQDPFWRRVTIVLFLGVAAYLGEIEPENLTLTEIDRFVAKYFCDDDATVSAVAKRLRGKFGEGSFAYRNWSAASSGTDKTRMNVLTSFQAVFSEFVGDQQLQKVSARHDVDFTKLACAEQPTVVYVQLDDASTANYAFAKVMFDQMYHSLREAASRQLDRRLPRHFAFFLDEIANAAKIPALATMLAMARSSNIGIHLDLQSLAQLDEVYGVNAAEIIRSNISVMAVLNTQCTKTWERVSALCGVNRLGNELIPAYRLARMKRGEVLFLRRGMRPFMSQLSDVTTSPWFCGLK